MPIRFIYFDLGRVILDFDPENMFARIARAAGLDAQTTHDALYASRYLGDIERGLCTSAELHADFVKRTGTRCTLAAMETACSDIFSLNASLLPVLSSLFFMDFPCGILSNTNAMHWEHCTAKYPGWLGGFSRYALSHEIGFIKPEPEIFEKAAELAGVAPDEIFFVDDTRGHVEGALQAGFDAELFQSGGLLAAQLRERGIPLNF